jgi:maltooligosyltrehalose trehalohydrolase
MKIGACYDKTTRQCLFTVWAPFHKSVVLRFDDRSIPMKRDEWGYWKATAEDVDPGTLYRYQLDESTIRPDPASFLQAHGVHGPSSVYDNSAFRWEDENWRCGPLDEMIMYEMHIGAFTAEGTFEAACGRLDALLDLGINAIEVMPVSQFPGNHSWGYDGVYLYAVQVSYGGPDGFKALVNACHKKGIAVILDVVYNHLGPEGNYLADYGPYFTDRCRTPWGLAVNFDDAYSNQVRNFFLENALFWFESFHVDALRLDAVHGIFDLSAKHILQELAERTLQFSKTTGCVHYLIAESDQNDSRIIKSWDKGGCGLDAQWSDDFHHSVHALLTGERQGYYLDFGEMDQLVASLRDGYAYEGQYSAYRKRNHGNSAKEISASRFVFFTQNHDQTGNRMMGDRTSHLLSFEALKLEAGILLLSPCIPLIFMGQEYGELARFFYFVDHSDPELIEAIRQGRKAEFKEFGWRGEPPDPQDRATFLSSKLHWEKRDLGKGNILYRFYRRLIALRKELACLKYPEKKGLVVETPDNDRIVVLMRKNEDSAICAVANFDGIDRQVRIRAGTPPGAWRKLLDSADQTWGGEGATVPDTIEADMSFTIRSHNLALFMPG